MNTPRWDGSGINWTSVGINWTSVGGKMCATVGYRADCD